MWHFSTITVQFFFGGQIITVYCVYKVVVSLQLLYETTRVNHNLMNVDRKTWNCWTRSPGAELRLPVESQEVCGSETLNTALCIITLQIKWKNWFEVVQTTFFVIRVLRLWLVSHVAPVKFHLPLLGAVHWRYVCLHSVDCRNSREVDVQRSGKLVQSDSMTAG